MRWVIFTIIDVVVILSSCLFTSGLCIFIVREYDDYATLTPHLTVDRSVMICGKEETLSMNMTIAYTNPFQGICAIGETFKSGIMKCDIEYLLYDSYNPALIDRSFQSDLSLRMHACGRRVEAIHPHVSNEVSLQYTLIRSDASLAASVGAVMLRRLTDVTLRTNHLQKRVYQCNQERSLGVDYLRRTVLKARDSLITSNDALGAMAELSKRGCPSVAHVGVGMRGDGYVAVLQERPLPAVEDVQKIYDILKIPFDTVVYSQAISQLQQRYDVHIQPDVQKYIQRFVSLHHEHHVPIPLERIEIGEAQALRAYIHQYTLATDHARSDIINALSTVCAFSVAAGGYAHEWDAGLVVQTLRRHDMRGAMHRAWRRDLDIQTRFDPPTHAEFVHATTPNVLSVVDDEIHDCAHTVRHFFADAYEASVFQMLVPPTLEQRIHRLFVKLQAQMQVVLRYDKIRNLFRGRIGPIQDLVKRTTLHLVGDRAPETHHVTAQDTILAMLDQASRATSERIHHVYDQNAPCSMAPLFGGVTTNAYFLYPFGCVVVGSGILVRPFADESYSDTALLMGIGYVMAHELGHALLAGTVDPLHQTQLFHAYPSSTYEEAIADLLGALAVVRIHGDREDMCIRLQQIWCVYTDDRISLEEDPSHPYPHKRWEDLCTLLKGFT